MVLISHREFDPRQVSECKLVNNSMLLKQNHAQARPIKFPVVLVNSEGSLAQRFGARFYLKRKIPPKFLVTISVICSVGTRFVIDRLTRAAVQRDEEERACDQRKNTARISQRIIWLVLSLKFLCFALTSSRGGWLYVPFHTKKPVD